MLSKKISPQNGINIGIYFFASVCNEYEQTWLEEMKSPGSIK